MKNKKYIISIDQGTTSSRAIVFDKNAEIVSSSSKEYTQIYTNGFVEHNPQEIFESVLSTFKTAIDSANIDLSQVDSVGITNQRETVIIWDGGTGEPVYNAIVWQCRRTSNYCNNLKNQGLSDLIYSKTGLVIDPYFSATKIKWILDNVSGAREKANNGQLLFGTVDTYLMWRLSNGKIFATDYSNASRTMLFNIHTKKWDDDLLRIFDIPLSMLAKVYPSSYTYGSIDKNIFGQSLPINSCCGDQQSALFGQLCTKKGQVKNTYGTGCFLLMNTGSLSVKSSNGLITSLGASYGDNIDYVLEGSVFTGGAVVKWLRDSLNLISSSKESETLAKSVDSTNGVYFVPAFNGLGAPHWDSSAKGMLYGITGATKKEHIVRAGLEAIAFQVLEVLNAMQADVGCEIKGLNVDGGASVNDFLMQFQSDILGLKVVRPANLEITALGVCYLAGLKSGFFESIESIKKIKQVDQVFMPQIEEKKRQNLVQGWTKCIKKVCADV